MVVTSLEATLYIADSIKVAFGSKKIGNRLLGIPNNAMISLSDYQTIASYCPMTIPNAQSNLIKTAVCTYKVLIIYIQQTKMSKYPVPETF